MFTALGIVVLALSVLTYNHRTKGRWFWFSVDITSGLVLLTYGLTK